jgi:phage antirepressor YoqD-like protein
MTSALTQPRLSGAQRDNAPAHAIVTREFEGKAFQFRDDGYFNMTKAARAFDRQAHEFLRLPSTDEYLSALSETYSHTGKIPVWVEAKRGGKTPGTWAHPKLAVFFARWLSPTFSVFCDAAIEDILKGRAELVITKPDESALVELAKAKAEAAQARAQVAKLEAEKAALLPDAEQARRFMSSKGKFSFRQAAKLVGFRSEHTLIPRLLEDEVIFVGSHGYEPYAQYRQRRLFTMRRFESNGTSGFQCLVTAKGVDWISRRYSAELDG